MKLWRILLLGALLSLVLQITVLWCVDDIYLDKRGEVIEVTRYEEKERIPLSKSLVVSNNITDIKFSSNCDFMAILSKGDLRIIDLMKDNNDKLIHKDNMQIKYYKWLPDRNMIIYAFTEKINGHGFINIETYDVETGIFGEYRQIKDMNCDAEVYKIEPSPLTNTVYVIVRAKNGKSNIYKYDIVENLSYVTSLKDVYRVYHLIHTDSLVFQNSENQIFKLDGNKELSRIRDGFNENSLLLGTDLRGLVYIGKLDEEKNISEIVFGKINDIYESASKRIKLKKSVLPENIDITPEGGIYTVFLNENSVQDVLNGTVIKYSGKFIQVSGKYIISVEDTKLRFTMLPVLH